MIEREFIRDVKHARLEAIEDAIARHVVVWGTPERIEHCLSGMYDIIVFSNGMRIKVGVDMREKDGGLVAAVSSTTIADPIHGHEKARLAGEQ